MHPKRSFPLEQLQQKHPEAFFQKLIFGKVKLVGWYLNPKLHLYSFGILFLLLISIHLLIPVVALTTSIQHHYTRIDLSMLCIIALLYPMVIWAYAQARVSSKCYTKQIQRCINIQMVLTFCILINSLILRVEFLSVFMAAVLMLSIRDVIIEALFTYECSAIERIQLQKIRQLAYWAHKQSVKAKPIPVAGISESSQLKQYYMDLNKRAYAEEENLASGIRYASSKDYLKRS